MTNKVIVIRNTNGSCGVIHPSPALFNPLSHERCLLRDKGIDFSDAEEEILNWIIDKDVAAGARYRVTDIANLPNDREFRDAWTDDFNTETVDIHNSRAKEIQLSKLRLRRGELLSNLDKSIRIAHDTDNTSEVLKLGRHRRELLDCTENLKALAINKDLCTETLNKLESLGSLEIMDKIAKFIDDTSDVKICISNEDGSCEIIDPTLAMFNNDMQLKQGLFEQDYRLVKESSLPNELRDAWTDDFNTETVDIHNEKARQVFLSNLRNERKVKLLDLDIEALRALEDGDSEWLEDTKAQKKILRDITEPLKNLVITKFNDPTILEQIKQLGNCSI